MANFPVFQGGQITEGVRTGLAIKEKRADRKARTQALEAERQLAASEQLLEQVDLRRTTVTQAIDNVSKGLRVAAANGKPPEELKNIMMAGDAFIASYTAYVNALAKQQVMTTGNPDAAQFFGDPMAFAETQRQRMRLAIEIGKGETGAARGAQTAEEKTALVQGIAENLGIPIEQVEQAAGLRPKPATPQRALVDGQPAFVREEGGRFEPVPGATPIPSGMSVTVGPDGGITLRTGEQLSKPTGSTLSNLQQSVVDSNDGIARLVGLQKSFDPEFLTFAGKIKGGFAAFKEKASIDLTPEEKTFLEDFTTFSQQAANNLNLYIKEITGAQMSEPEADRLRKGIPDPENDSPTQFQTNMNSSIDQLLLARARALHVLSQGLDANPWEVIGLNEMNNIIRARISELEQQLGSRDAALEQAAKEFGL